MLLKKLLVVLLSSLLMAVAVGCEREGPAERTGERIDETTEEVGERAEEATK
jgi:hypothetical protein